MPSADHSRRGLGALGALLVAVMVCGCASTQTTAARLQLNDDRIRASEVPVKSTTIGTSSSVHAGGVTVLPGGHTVAVALANASANTVSDLPVLVGYKLGARTVYLNAGTQTDYFNNHIPAIAGHGSLTWVATVNVSHLPKHATVFAAVGANPTSPAGAPSSLPKITVQTQTLASDPGLAVRVTNSSSIPQYQLQVYAVITKGTRIIDASSAAIADLEGGATAKVKVKVPSGSSGAYQLRVEAPATILK